MTTPAFLLLLAVFAAGVLCGAATVLVLACLLAWFNAYDATNRPRRFVSGHNPPDRSKQLAVVEAAGDGSTLKEIATRTGQSLNAVKAMASKLVQQHKLTRKGRGIYGS